MTVPSFRVMRYNQMLAADCYKLSVTLGSGEWVCPCYWDPLCTFISFC